MKKVYLFDDQTGAYLHDYDAQESPLEPGVFIVPESSTDLYPEIVEGFHPVFVNGAWVQTPDYRGHAYFDMNGNQHIMTEIGNLPDGSSFFEPTSAKRTRKIAEINQLFIAESRSGLIVDGIKLNSDLSDIQRLKSAYDLAVLAGDSSLPVLVDYDNVPHYDIPLVSVQAMILELGTNYQVLYKKRADLRKAIMDLQEGASDQDFEAITWA